MRNSSYYNMQEAAKILNIKKFGRTKLMRFLKENRILMADNTPSVQYVIDGEFSLYYKPVRGFHGRIMKRVAVPLISSTGIELIKNLINQNDETSSAMSSRLPNSVTTSKRVEGKGVAEDYETSITTII